MKQLKLFVLLAILSFKSWGQLTFTPIGASNGCGSGDITFSINGGTQPYQTSLDGTNYSTTPQSSYYVIMNDQISIVATQTMMPNGLTVWVKDANNVIGVVTGNNAGYATWLGQGTVSGTAVDVSILGANDGKIQNLMYNQYTPGSPAIGLNGMQVKNIATNNIVYNGPIVSTINNLPPGVYGVSYFEMAPISVVNWTCPTDEATFTITEPPGISVQSNGNVSIQGYTQLGGNSPAIQMQSFTGTTSATVGGTVNIPHGLSLSKILSVIVQVTNNAGQVVQQGDISGNNLFFVSVDNTNVIIANANGTDANILGRPLTILITYEQ